MYGLKKRADIVKVNLEEHIKDLLVKCHFGRVSKVKTLKHLPSILKRKDVKPKRKKRAVSMDQGT